MTVQARCRSCLENHPACRPKRGVMFKICFFLNFPALGSMEKKCPWNILFSTNHLSPQKSPTTDMSEVPLSWILDWKRRNMNCLLIISHFFLFLVKDNQKELRNEEWCAANLSQYSGKGQPSTYSVFSSLGNKQVAVISEGVTGGGQQSTAELIREAWKSFFHPLLWVH